MGAVAGKVGWLNVRLHLPCKIWTKRADLAALNFRLSFRPAFSTPLSFLSFLIGVPGAWGSAQMPACLLTPSQAGQA